MLTMVNQSLALKVNLGIGKYSSSDHYAVLGLPVYADASQIRPRYLSIAKTLHPDVYGKSLQESDRACLYLSKLVSPAYNALMNEKERVEYQSLLKLIVKRLMKRSEGLEPQSEVARRLAAAPSKTNYEKAVHSLAEMQYQILDKSLEYTGQLSELNLIYVLAQSGYLPNATPVIAVSSPTFDNSINLATDSLREKSTLKANPPQTSTSQTSTSSSSPISGIDSPINKSTGNGQGNVDSRVNAHINSAEQYIERKQWSFALKELRDTLQLSPNSSKCHALLGWVYVNQNLPSMAKVSFQQALKINPQEPLALQYFQQSKITKESNVKANKPHKGGFFGWLGGGS